LSRLQGRETRTRQPVLQAEPTSPEPAIERTCWGTERRDGTTTVALQTSAQNGTSGTVADSTHVRPWAALPKGRTAVR
jgi:hypothetical protein